MKDAELMNLLQRGVSLFEEWEMLASAEEITHPSRLLDAFSHSRELMQLIDQWLPGLLLLNEHRAVIACTNADHFPISLREDLSSSLLLNPDQKGVLSLPQRDMPFVFAPLGSGLLLLFHADSPTNSHQL